MLPPTRHPATRPVFGPAGCVVIEAARSVGFDDANSAGSSPRRPPGDLGDGRPGAGGGRRGGLGRHNAVGLLPGRPGRGHSGGPGLWDDRGQRAPPAPDSRSTTPTATRSPGRAWSSRAPRPTGASSNSSNTRARVHPFLVATQAHPELKSRPTSPAPVVPQPHRSCVGYKGGRAPACRDQPPQRRTGRRRGDPKPVAE